MSQTQKERLTNIMDSAAGRIKLGDKIKCEASGPQLVMAPNQNGSLQLQLGWQFTLWLEHNKLIGQDPIGVTVPVGGLLPPAELVEQAVPYLLEEARKLRQQANSPATATPSADEMIAQMKDMSRQ